MVSHWVLLVRWLLIVTTSTLRGYDSRRSPRIVLFQSGASKGLLTIYAKSDPQPSILIAIKEPGWHDPDLIHLYTNRHSRPKKCVHRLDVQKGSSDGCPSILNPACVRVARRARCTGGSRSSAIAWSPCICERRNCEINGLQKKPSGILTS